MAALTKGVNLKLRDLQFDDESACIEELLKLRSGCRSAGSWSFEQASWHLNFPIAHSLNGTPANEPTSEQKAQQAFVEQVIASGYPEGMPAPSEMIPPAQPGKNAVDELIISLRRLQRYTAPKIDAFIFGPLETEKFRGFVLRHAAHHLGFFEPQLTTAVPTGFSSATRYANGTTIHYVSGGLGPLLVLLHGWPQDWSEFRQILPRLAEKFTVIAVDLRGIGGSEATEFGYEATNLATDVHDLVGTLKGGKAYLVGHDLGGIVAYAYARLFSKDVQRLMMLEAPAPGLPPWEALLGSPKTWHVHFYQTPRIPELLIAGREASYFEEFLRAGVNNPKSITDADVARYAHAYSSPSQLRAGLEIYRAFPANEAFNAAQHENIGVPLLLVGGGGFGPALPAFAESLRGAGWSHVNVKILNDQKHYILDEQREFDRG